MRIINKEQFLKEPDGTVFVTYNPNVLDDNIMVKTGYYKRDGKVGFNGVTYLCPCIEYGTDCGYNDIPNNFTNYHADFSTIDTSDIDFDDNTLFAVFTKNEVRKVISILTWALCNGDARLEVNEDEHRY